MFDFEVLGDQSSSRMCAYVLRFSPFCCQGGSLFGSPQARLE